MLKALWNRLNPYAQLRAQREKIEQLYVAVRALKIALEIENCVVTVLVQSAREQHMHRTTHARALNEIFERVYGLQRAVEDIAETIADSENAQLLEEGVVALARDEVMFGEEEYEGDAANAAVEGSDVEADTSVEVGLSRDAEAMGPLTPATESSVDEA